MKHFKSFVKEKFQIPPEDIDDLLFKTQVIVNNDIKKNLKGERYSTGEYPLGDIEIIEFRME